MSVRAQYAGDGNRKLIWPLYKPVSKDPVLGMKEMTPEQTLIEFICTSASLHRVNRQSIRQLEWDILKVFPYNIMPANAAAWYMAKRKFYANQPQDNQLLPFIIKKYPEKFRVNGYQVEFLEKYNVQTARHKLNYLVHYGLNAYFSHKVDEYGVYFFDPNYYEKTEPFHSSLQLCARGRRVNMLGHYFGWNEEFIFQQHSTNLASLTRSHSNKIKVMTNNIGVIFSMAKNGQYGFLKFGSGEKALFCAKGLFKDGYQYTGDPLRLPAIYFDAYQIPGGVKAGDGMCSWFAVAVWTGKRPAAKFYCTLADFRLTPSMLSQTEGSQRNGGRRLRQPSSSMMIGQVIEIRRNGAVVSVRDDSKERVFIPGWSRQNLSKQGVWLTTLTGDTIGMRDLIAYYLDTSRTIPGFTAVGKNVMVLKEHEEVEFKRRRRSQASISLSEGARYDTETGLTTDTEHDLSDAFSTSDESEGEEVSDGELEWLLKDVEDLISKEKSSDMVNFLVKTHDELAEARAAAATKKSSPSGRERKDSGLGSKPTTPVNMKPLKSKECTPEGKAFSRTKAALASIDEEYRSSDDEDYETGDEVSSLESTKAASRRRQRLTSTAESSGKEEGSSEKVLQIPQVLQPFWVRAISLPEEYEPETGMFIPVDRHYTEEKDRDYELPMGVDVLEVEHDGVLKIEYEQYSEDEGIEDEEEEDLDAELKLLKEEAANSLPQDLLDGKHNPSLEEFNKKEEAKEESQAETKPEDDKEKAENEQPESESSWKDEFEVRKIWYEQSYIRFIQTLQLDEPEADYFDSEYYPSSIIVDADLDYDEFNEEEEAVTPEELQGLKDDLKLAVSSFGNYVPIWVPVDSVQARKDAAKKLAEEEQKRAADKAAKAAEAAAAKAATAEAKDAAVEQTDKTAEGGETVDEAKSEKPLDLQGLEEAAKLVTDDSKPQRKLSVKSSPKKKSPKKEGSPKPETEVKESPKKQGSPKSRSPKKSGGASPK